MSAIFFTRNQAPGAMPNGARIVKILMRPGDSHEPGAEATVLGSMGPIEEVPGGYIYFVEWDSHPGLPVAVTANAIAEKPA